MPQGSRQGNWNESMGDRFIYDSRNRPEVPQNVAASFRSTHDFRPNGNCRLGLAFLGTCYLLQVYEDH